MATSNAVRVQTARREKVIVNSFTIMVPSVTINQVTPTGTITLKQRVCFRGGKTKNRDIVAKTKIITTQALDNDHRRQKRPGSPTCGDPAAAAAVGRMETAANRRDTYGSVMNINPIFTTGDSL